MEKKISYLNKNFNDFRQALEDFVQQYYPNLTESINDASVGSFFLDLNAAVADNLGYYIDRAYQETNINSAQETGSLYNIARTNGVKLPGPKASMVPIEVSCILPMVESSAPNSSAQQRHPNWAYAPVLKKGTQVAAGTQIFEFDSDVDFSHQFNDDGVSDRTYVPLENSYGTVVSYKVTKTVMVVAGESKIYKREISNSDIEPFFNVTLPYTNILGVESIIFKEGNSLQTDPTYAEFMVKKEYTSPEYSSTDKPIYRFFEVNNLAEQYVWGDSLNEKGQSVKYTYGYRYNGITIPTFSITKGEWKPIRQKFITEYTDKNYLKITFGAGRQTENETLDLGDVNDYYKYLISKMINNDSMGILPNPGMTMYVLYRVGGGSQSNVGIGAINTLKSLNIEFGTCNDRSKLDNDEMAKVRNSIKVTNKIASVSGKDRLDADEIRNYIKYNNGSANRCVTTKDYHAKVLQMPYKYGAAYRVGVTEENNKIMIYLLGLNENGYLTTVLPDRYVKNLTSYLSEYRMINDFVEMKSGKIVNISMEADICIDKSYNAADVVGTVMNTIKDYMDISKHQMGDEIYLGDLQKEICKTDGVINMMDLRVYNEYDSSKYSSTITSQQTVSDEEYIGSLAYKSPEDVYMRSQIDIEASDYILYTENDTMMEIKYPEVDIRIQYKLR